MRYRNYYIHQGCRKARRERPPQQRQTLNTVEKLLEDDDLSVEFDLRPHQMLFTNNRWALHKRNAYVDHENPDQRRHDLRNWLSGVEGGS